MSSNVTSPRVQRTDWGLLFIVLTLVIVGSVMVYSASYGFALMDGGIFEGQPTYFVRRQIIFALAGIVAMLVLSRIDYRLYRRFALHILVLTLVVLVPMAIWGRWLLKKTHSIQPVEVAKIGVMIYIAVWLAGKGEQIRSLSVGLIPFALLLGFMSGLIVLQPDFSTAVILVATSTAMFFAAGSDMKQLLIAFLFGGIALVFVAMLAPYRFDRIDLWLRGPFSDARGKGFQTVQSLKALNLGGFLGVGLGQSQQKFAIYAPHSDGVFAIIAEELGFVGAVAVMGLYGLWTWRGLRVARRAADPFAMLLAVGLVCWVTFQALLHVAVTTASTPFTGTVLPFVSSGGSSLISQLAAVGILLNIARGPRDAEAAGRS